MPLRRSGPEQRAWCKVIWCAERWIPRLESCIIQIHSSSVRQRWWWLFYWIYMRYTNTLMYVCMYVTYTVHLRLVGKREAIIRQHSGTFLDPLIKFEGSNRMQLIQSFGWQVTKMYKYTQNILATNVWSCTLALTSGHIYEVITRPDRHFHLTKTTLLGWRSFPG